MPQVQLGSLKITLSPRSDRLSISLDGRKLITLTIPTNGAPCRHGEDESLLANQTDEYSLYQSGVGKTKLD